MHKQERKGKISAINRAMKQVTTAITVFTDANTFLNKDTLINIARHYANNKVGAVSREKELRLNKLLTLPPQKDSTGNMNHF